MWTRSNVGSLAVVSLLRKGNGKDGFRVDQAAERPMRVDTVEMESERARLWLCALGCMDESVVGVCFPPAIQSALTQCPRIGRRARASWKRWRWYTERMNTLA